jgi:hypothetical protein
MKILITILLVGIFSCDNTKEAKTNDLGRIEKVTEDEKLKLIGDLQPQFEYLASYDTWKEDALDDFYFVDLDNDQDLDVIFTGWSGAEPVCVRILNNKNGKYNRVFEAYQKISNLEFTDNTLSRLSIHDPGCCAAYIAFDEDFEFKVTKDDFKCNLINRSALLYPTEEPKEQMENPMRFEVLNDKYYLRLTPKIDTIDQVFAEDMQPDNVIAEFKKGARGIVYGQREDETGRVWWFVEMDPAFKPVKSLFYDIDEKPTKLKGWMSSNYLRKL